MSALYLLQGVRRSSERGLVLVAVENERTGRVVVPSVYFRPAVNAMPVYEPGTIFVENPRLSAVLRFSVRTNRSLAAGHYFEARKHYRRVWANAALRFALAASLFLGAITLLDEIGNPCLRNEAFAKIRALRDRC